MKNRLPALFALALTALLGAKPSFAGVVLEDWIGPPRLGASTSQPGPDPARTVPQTEPAKSVPAATEVVNSISQNELVLPPDGPHDPPIAPVPEPSTWAMLILGFAAIAFLKYRRRSTATGTT